MGYKSGYQDEGENWRAWRPILGIFLAIFFLLASLAGDRRSVPADMGGLIGYTIGTLILVYGIPYYFAFRRAHTAWKVIGFLVIAPLALLVNMANAGRNIGAFRDEMRTTSGDLQAVVDGKTVSATGAATTPSGVIRNLLADLQANQKSYEAKLTQSGVLDLLDPAALQRNPAVLRDCGATERMRSELTLHRGTMEKRLADARNQMLALPGSRDVGEGMVEGFDESMAANRAEFARRWDLGDQSLVELGAICRVLARRTWKVSGEEIIFSSTRDMEDYNAAITRYNTVYTEQAALEAQAEARARAGIREMKGL
jgi:hypothetical protein